MSAEQIDRIEIRKDGIFLSTHIPKDSNSYRIWRCDELSEVYQKKGQKGLDREMVNILYEYAVLGKFHKSTARYHSLFQMPEVKQIEKKY